jgi:hypothetical protein
VPFFIYREARNGIVFIHRHSTAQDWRVKRAMPGLRFSHLSASRQLFVRLCQAMNYGLIQNLEVRDSEPVFSPPPVVSVEVKLDIDDCTRSEVGLADFGLPRETLRLMAQLDEIQNGVIEKIEVRAGIPRRLVFSFPSSALLR